jgi:hypothetical protein
VRGSDTRLTAPQVFSRLPFGDGGLLAFQGLSRGDGLLTMANDSPGRARP